MAADIETLDAWLERELSVAVTAVRCAADVCQRIQRTLVDGETLQKRDRSPVTIADFAAQAIVCAALGEGSRVTAIVGEENTDALRGNDAAPLRRRVVDHVRQVRQDADIDQVLAWIDAGGFDPAHGSRYWTLDPIDGTKGFLRGQHYAVALALIDDGEVVLATLACPAWDSLLTAVRGEGAAQLPLAVGATTRGTPIRVAGATGLRFCESVESGHSDQSRSAQIAERLGIKQPPLRIDSQAKYAAVARGDAAIYLRLPTSADYREKIWDHAAGMLVVSEAGGRVTDITGAALDFGRGRTLEANAGIIATNGSIHDAVVAAVSATSSA